MRAIWILLALISGLLADLIVNEVTKYSDGGIFESKSYYKDGYFKSVSNNETMIVDLKKNTIWFLYNEKKLYFGGQIDSMIDLIKASYRSEMDAEPEVDIPLPEDEMEVDIKLVESKVKIGKYTTDKYQVVVADELKEELFIDKSIKSNIDVRKMIDLMQKLDAKSTRKYGLDSRYIDLITQGYPIRIITYDGDVVVTEVQNIEKKELPVDEFLPPADFKRTTPQEVFH